MSDPVGLTMAGKIDVLLILGKGQNMWNGQTEQEEIKEIFMLFTVDRDLH